VPRVLLLIASVRSGRVGGTVGDWVEQRLVAHAGFEIDRVDLAELRLPLMDEPHHPKLRQYVGEPARAWSARVDAADAFVFVMPEYNHSFTAPLKNALDYLVHEWAWKPVGLVAYGGLAGGARAVVALEPVLTNLRLLEAGPAVEIAWVHEHVEGGVFRATERHDRALDAQIAAVHGLLEQSATLRA
jgi:NAD(P)H-dependent FMN reductase